VIRQPLVVLFALVCVRPAALVLGSSFADTDCTIAFGGVDADAGTSGVVCVDGDPATPTPRPTASAPSRCGSARVTADGCGTRRRHRPGSRLALETPPLDVDGACGGAALTVATGHATGVTTIARGAPRCGASAT
jgi:hypothetical protein